MRTSPCIAAALALATLSLGSLSAQQNVSAQERAAFQRELQAPRPIAALNSVWIEELTWMEVRDAMAGGKTTVLVPTGGIEQNGPYVATGKHNYVLKAVCPELARELGDALCAPIIKLVPEGEHNPPTGHMRYPGTISLTQATFEAVLEDVGRSMRAHGFEHIVYIGDSGGNQRGMENVAMRLNQEWGENVAHYIPEFYDNDGLEAYMHDELGIVPPRNDGYHDFYWLTAMQMVTDPTTVRYQQRVDAGLAHINGLSIENMDETLAVGRKLIQWRVTQTATAIRAARTGG